MKLADLTVQQYLETLASGAPAPGGGSASALCGAQGAGLVAMVAHLTLGKKKYEQYQAACEALLPQAMELHGLLTEQIDLDTQAFEQVAAAFSLPKQTPEEQAVRRQAIEDATVLAAKVPLHTMELALGALELAVQLSQGFNRSAASDLAVAALNLSACVHGAWRNVLINCDGMEENESCRTFAAKGREITAQTDKLSALVLERTR